MMRLLVLMSSMLLPVPPTKKARKMKPLPDLLTKVTVKDLVKFKTCMVQSTSPKSLGITVPVAYAYVEETKTDDGEAIVTEVLLETLTIDQICLLCKQLNIKGCQNLSSFDCRHMIAGVQAHNMAKFEKISASKK